MYRIYRKILGLFLEDLDFFLKNISCILEKSYLYHLGVSLMTSEVSHACIDTVIHHLFIHLQSVLSNLF